MDMDERNMLSVQFAKYARAAANMKRQLMKTEQQIEESQMLLQQVLSDATKLEDQSAKLEKHITVLRLKVSTAEKALDDSFRSKTAVPPLNFNKHHYTMADKVLQKKLRTLEQTKERAIRATSVGTRLESEEQAHCRLHERIHEILKSECSKEACSVQTHFQEVDGLIAASRRDILISVARAIERVKQAICKAQQEWDSHSEDSIFPRSLLDQALARFKISRDVVNKTLVQLESDNYIMVVNGGIIKI